MVKQTVKVDPQLIKQGFQINELTMGDADTGNKLWVCQDSQQLINSEKEIQANIPKEILQCKSVSRDINFSSAHTIKKLSLKQIFSLNGQPIEQFSFDFGFVIPGSTNNWQSIIQASEEMIPVEILSGNLVVETKFYDEDNLICSINVRIFYV
ncbi:retinal rod rhodopsin-sensitive cGMP 3,5-cyclic phosphodiesterase subunit delta (macronuclear) [Tetrahymena thermophila SB210]|uniref:Retinal rod rhodopsin-sensitive cGMP 3,5-cyclic phosphodiesterase subunit delta n=1 Tax=Tetrahymena thermophila (strain SB210) TaxID=312017 RepID=I7M6Z3_TETTS|nr:retinal rod rhodopsin-sensitive cGMP 3,5-cyclic phosphodiesterase subunit delta [Tetrahymena thermophila SB210]EAR87530.2 retinal rod rhodopsin-sensitive cGMP 3,5-cyclic phosphodiesterase subunit delta [Tetrahymena thermophila SB210]|eukprot:XP_001007775.2 retinal rod rhodopsin-sensitive cGMP 3,5-cyclic phosphodiesterase subunit delta [Tetrahymena thermophila SB210]